MRKPECWLSINPNNVNVSGETTVSLTLSALPNAPVGNHTLRLQGSAGNQTASTQFSLTLNPPPGSGLWTRQFGTGSDDAALGVAVDNSGNIVVVGLTGGTLPGNGQTHANAGWADAFVRKYNDSGGP
ncbi:MAG: SBBP repeat-containing protein [Thermus sp.]|nr:SBBP repeat-containing protein [Thermus sp.]